VIHGGAIMGGDGGAAERYQEIEPTATTADTVLTSLEGDV
jgi:hypothetical protein